ncbi:MAG: sigma-70 family RNA polymerase sigma factor [Planctomycetota bacterium]
MFNPQSNTLSEWEFADFLASVDPVIYAIIRQNPVAGAETEDIAQDSRIGLSGAWHRYRCGKDIRDPEGLAARITKCVCIKYIHRAKKERLLQTIAPNAVRELHTYLRLHQPETREVDEIEQLQQVLLGLSETDLQILVQRFVRDETYNQIAGKLGLHTSTVCRRVQRLLEYLRKRIG